MARDWPIFGRDGEGVAWRPTPELRHDSQLAAWLGLDPGDLSGLDEPGTLEAIRSVAIEEGASR